MKRQDREKFVYNELSTNKKIHKTLAITKIIGYNNNCIKKLERVGTNPTLKCVLREWNMSSIEGKIEKLVEINPLTGKVTANRTHVIIFPNSHYVTTSEKMLKALDSIEKEKELQVKYFKILFNCLLKGDTLWKKYLF